MIKKFGKYFIYSGFRIFFRRQFLRHFKPIETTKTIWIVDIDDTLADTWRHFFKPINEGGTDGSYRHLPPLSGMCRLVIDAQNQGTTVVFLTARRYKRYFDTRFWLRQNGFYAHMNNLILVENAAAKFDLLKKIPPQYDAHFFDDLSFGHERGEPQMRHELIEKIKKLPIKYIGLDDINRLNNNREL